MLVEIYDKPMDYLNNGGSSSKNANVNIPFIQLLGDLIRGNYFGRDSQCINT